MAEASTPERVLVSGATGYLAAHVIKLLQEKGYQVRGTVRSLENEDKVNYIKELVPEAAHPVELVEADCTKEDGWKSAVEGCTYIIHTASPMIVKTPPDENDIITPAVEGVKNVLKAAKEAKCVKRVVMTSAGLAMMGYLRGGEFSEKDWPEKEDELDAYAKSKTKAEKEAWEFVKNLEDGEKFELAVINPTAILGPVLHKQMGTSMEIMKRILTKNPPMLPKLNIPVVDVRDVAQAHYMAMTTPEAAGNRHIVSTGNIWWSEIAAHVAEEFKPQGYKIATMGCPKVGLQLAAIFDKDIKAILPNWNVVTKVDTTRMKEVLKIEEPIDIKTTVVDMAYSMIEGGFVKKTTKYRGRNWKEIFEQEKAEKDQAKAEKIAAKRASKTAKKPKVTAEAKNGDAEAVKENGEEKQDEGTEKEEVAAEGEKQEAPKSEEKAEEQKEEAKEGETKEEAKEETIEEKQEEAKEETVEEKQEEAKEEVKEEKQTEEEKDAEEQKETKAEEESPKEEEAAPKAEESPKEEELAKEDVKEKEPSKEEDTKEEQVEEKEVAEPKETETVPEEEKAPEEEKEEEKPAEVEETNEVGEPEKESEGAKQDEEEKQES